MKDGAGLVRLTNGPVDTQPAFSADGRRLAYVAQVEGKRCLVVADAAQPDRFSVLAGVPEGASEPSFSADGSQLACTAPVDGFAQVLVVSLSSGTPRRVAACADDDS